MGMVSLNSLIIRIAGIKNCLISVLQVIILYWGEKRLKLARGFLSIWMNSTFKV